MKRFTSPLLLFSATFIMVMTLRGILTAAQASAAGPAVDYNWDVKPILSDNCFRCHGPDEKSRRAGLRLDNPDSAYAALSGRTERHAIVPGDAEHSELVKRITADTPAVRMPPASTNKTLTPQQIETLKQWIEQGAKYKPHWAYIAPTRAAVAVVTNTRVVNEIDRFVISRLEREGLSLSPEADKETLINRVTLTLTGLPPTLADVDAFVNDKSPNAYEKVVDRLLASPHYGEHMAEYWLNAARYSESDGFLDDLHDRLFWPYRDWVIKAFNTNLPYDQFGTWQLAGDLLPSHTKEQTLATAFLRLNKRTTENGAIDEEYRVEYMVDRANTVGATFLGLTVGCARCHDHKYDPISQKDFYSLGAFFNSTDEPGYYTPGQTGVTAGPTLNWTDAATDAKLKAADQAVQRAESAYEVAQAAARRDATTKAVALMAAPQDVDAQIRKSVETSLVAYYGFEETSPIPDDQLPKSRERNRRPAPPPLAPETRTRNPFAALPPAAQQAAAQAPANEQQTAAQRALGFRLPSDLVRDSLTWSPSGTPGVGPAVLESASLKDGVKGKAFYFDDTNRGVFAPGVGDFERTQPFSLDLWIRAAKVYDDAMVLNNRENDFLGNAGYQLNLEKNHLRFDLMHSRAGNRVVVVTKQQVPIGQWTHLTVTYDGSSKARGVALYIDGVRGDLDVISDNLNRSTLPNGGGTLGDEYLGLQFGKRFRMTALVGGAIDEVRLFKAALTPVEVRYLQQAASTGGQRGETSREQIVDLLVANDSRVATAAARLAEAREAQNQTISRVPEVMVMGDALTPRQAYVLLRGQYTDHGDPVSPRGLSQIFPWNDALPQNRLGLAIWIFDPNNPLTARVLVNRLWQVQFGRGLVETSEDFGAQGQIPSHPDLLDWLAVTFRDSGWDIKRMQKLIVMSATFRQSSNVSDELLKKDPRNVLVARYPRVRMPAELVRDNALAASGLLVTTVGGPSAYPYQPDGIWDGLAGYVYPATDKIPVDDHHRRTMYSFIKRNAPHPELATFDMPDRGGTTVRRQTSNTPLQALVLLDDPQFLEAYRDLARHVMHDAADRDARITLMFRLATRRRPLSSEIGPMRAYYDSQVQRYSADRKSAVDLVKVGVTPVDQTVDVVQLAALMNLTAAVMNTPDAYSIH
jgi:mono/diheme cytochrome c family protein